MGKMTTRYEVTGRDVSLGVYEAETPEAAILAAVLDAGYASIVAMDEATGEACDLRATEPEAAKCETCGVSRETRTCVDCGETASVIDCGHYAQPAEIAASSVGDRCHVCEDCEAERVDARAAAEVTRTRCQCDETSGGTGCGTHVDDADAVTLAWVPTHLRDMITASHTEARAMSLHAVRLRVARDCAEVIIAADGAQWAQIAAEAARS